jgi:hypothetical protein
VASLETGNVSVIAPNGLHVATITVGGGSSAPAALGFGPEGHLFVLDADASRVQEFNVAGAEVSAFDLPSGDYAASGLAFGADGHLFVTDGSQVQELDLTGVPVRAFGGTALTTPAGLAFGPMGRLYVADGAQVTVLDQAGNVAGTIAHATLADARRLAFGPDGHLFVSTIGGAGDAVLEFKADGTLADTLGPGDGLDAPAGLAFAPWRFKASIRGRVARPGEKLAKVKELSAVISLQPGSRTLMVTLTDDVSNNADLASVFDAGFLLLHGFEAAQSDSSSQRLFHGAQVPGVAQQDGVASLVLRIKGKLKSGDFVVSSARGEIHRAGAAGVYTATIKTGKLLK